MGVIKALRLLNLKVALALAFTLLLPISAQAGETELVMFSAKSCVYCQVFKREVAPNYRWSRVARKAPLRVINITVRGTGGYALRQGISVTPTFVMFKRGREVARIPGYPGKKNFYKMVNHILKKIR